MNEQTLKGKKLDLYVLLKIIKYCTGSSARSYQCKYAVNEAFMNKSIESMEEVGAAIKEIIHYQTIRGKFSSVHPDLAAEGITRVEVEEEGLHFIKTTKTGSISAKSSLMNYVYFTFIFSDDAKEEMFERLLPPTEEEESRALAMSLEPEDEEVEITLEQEEEEGPSSIKGELQWNVRMEYKRMMGWLL